ncbi:hypothetical protein QA641_25640 [Bradyrhizobium sp. CB1650]|uniref:hypothetical protein n=1 Tax=Bradyrhizobium sp. CB1650 TaxID=3039153 RepID=UPI002434E609|nr:hypothetical protein [Bradyrhizobium sp. CB1650]WGD49021.1 hypothetical protein QA641_25640 [Bradyrhizobium sp. CB1650]
MHAQPGERLGRDRLAPQFRSRGILHGGDQRRQPTPAARFASPNLWLPFWPHLPRLPDHGFQRTNLLPAFPFRYPERIREDVICFT